jgi:hypothetical protein
MSAHPDAVSDLQTIRFDFQAPHREKSTTVITVHPNTDPKKHGQLITFPDHPASDFLGFPICQARITSPQSVGYAAMYGWIQMFRHAVPPNTASETPWQMDDIPMTAGLNTPFCWFGAEPQLFDAPSQWPEVTELDWTALSFLTYAEDALLSKNVRPILAFEWGYWIRGGVKSVKPLKVRDVSEAWEAQRSLLEAQFRGWNFKTLESSVSVAYSQQCKQ